MILTVYRVQDIDGRGPFKPGFSHFWVEERDDHTNLRPFFEEFGNVIERTGWPFGKHHGCATRTVEQLRRWFTPTEYARLQAYGYQAVRMDADRILAESDVQCVIQRSRPLFAACEPFDLYAKEPA